MVSHSQKLSDKHSQLFDNLLQTASAASLAFLGLRGDSYYIYPLLAASFCTATLSLLSVSTRRTLFSAVLILSLVTVMLRSSPLVVHEEVVDKTTFKTARNKKVPESNRSRSCKISLLGDEYTVIYSNQDLIDPGVDLTGSCKDCVRSDSTTFGQRVSTVEYSIVCPERNQTVSRIVHIRERPTPTILYRSDNKIYVYFSSGVKGSDGVIDERSFLIDDEAVGEVKTLGEYRGFANVYSIGYKDASAKKISISNDNCLDVSPPYGHCAGFVNSLASVPSASYIDWTVAFKLADEGALTLSIAFGDLVVSGGDSLGPDDFRVEMFEKDEAESWFSFNRRSSRLLRVVYVEAVESGETNVVVIEATEKIDGARIKVSIVSDVYSSGSAMSVDKNPQELTVQLGSCCLDQGERCELVHDSISCLELGGSFVLRENDACVCSLPSFEVEVEEQEPTFFETINFSLKGASPMLMYVGERVRDPGANVQGIDGELKSIVDGDGVRAEDGYLLAKGEGEFKISYVLGERLLERVVKVRVGAPRMQMLEFGEGYKSVTVEFSSVPTRIPRGLVNLWVGSFLVIAKRGDGSLSKAIPKLMKVTPVSVNEKTETSWFGGDSGFSHATQYTLSIDWSFGSAWADNDELIITLAKDECWDTLPPYHKCSSKARDAIRTPLHVAPSIVDARVIKFFGEGGMFGYNKHESSWRAMAYMARYTYRRGFLGSILGWRKTTNEVIVQVSFDADLRNVSLAAFEATLLKQDVSYDRFTQTTASVDRSWKYAYLPVWMMHKLVPWLIYNPYLHYREGPAVVGDGVVNMGDGECGVPAAGVPVSVIAVEYVYSPPVVDEAEAKRLREERRWENIGSMDVLSVAKILIRAGVRRVWMVALDFVIGESINSKTAVKKEQSEKRPIKVKATYAVHLSIPVVVGEGDLLVMNVKDGLVKGLHESRMSVPCRAMVVDVWESLVNDDSPRPMSVVKEKDVDEVRKGGSLFSWMFSVGWLFVVVQVMLFGVAVVGVLHFQGIAGIKGVGREKIGMCVGGGLGVLLGWCLVGTGIREVAKGVWEIVGSEAGL